MVVKSLKFNSCEYDREWRKTATETDRQTCSTKAVDWLTEWMNKFILKLTHWTLKQYRTMWSTHTHTHARIHSVRWLSTYGRWNLSRWRHSINGLDSLSFSLFLSVSWLFHSDTVQMVIGMLLKCQFIYNVFCDCCFVSFDWCFSVRCNWHSIVS